MPADEIERAKASIASDMLASLDFAHAQIQRCTREGALDIAPHAGRLSDAEQMFPIPREASRRALPAPVTGPLARESGAWLDGGG